jgi:hypothetical protein
MSLRIDEPGAAGAYWGFPSVWQFGGSREGFPLELSRLGCRSYRRTNFQRRTFRNTLRIGETETSHARSTAPVKPCLPQALAAPQIRRGYQVLDKIK